MSVGSLLARLVEAQRAYLEAVLDGLVAGRAQPEAKLRLLARDARVAFADAEGPIGLALNEPPQGGSDPRAARATLGALRRVVFAVHALRLQATLDAGTSGIPELGDLRTAVLELLSRLASVLRVGSGGHYLDQVQPEPAQPQPGHLAASGALPPLRRLLRDLAEGGLMDADPTLWAELDELVDAVDTAAATAGLG